MQPIKVDANMVNDLVDARVVEYAAPPGEEASVDAVQGIFELGVPGRFGPDRIYIPWRPDADELKSLETGAPVWLVVMGHRMPVVQMYVQPLPGEENVRLRGGPHDGSYIDRSDVRDDSGLKEQIDFDDASVYSLAGDSYVFAGTNPGPSDG